MRSSLSRLSRPITALALLLALGLPAPVAARWPWRDKESIYPRLVATVTALGRRGLATLTTEDGARYEVVAGTGWRVGTTVLCTQSDRAGVPAWQQLQCRAY